MSIIARWMLAAIDWYRKDISHLKGAPSCRFTPTCSTYGREAVATHGALKGGWLTVWRVLRCNPMSACRHDPVPPKPWPKR